MTQTILTDPNRLITSTDAARLLCVAPETLANWRSAARYPDLPYVRLGGGRAVRYRLADVEAFVAKHTVGEG